MPTNSILIYQSDDGKISVETLVKDETVWLAIEQMSQLFGKARSTINEHILNIFREEQLFEQASRQTQTDSFF
jgi:hypothetical protein